MVSHLTSIRPYHRSPVPGTLSPETHFYRNIRARPRALADGEVIASHCRQVGLTLNALISIANFSFKIRRAMARFVASWRVLWLACLVLIHNTNNTRCRPISRLCKQIRAFKRAGLLYWGGIVDIIYCIMATSKTRDH